MKSFGKYEVLEEIGKGATATVYRAKDNSMGREVALKVFDPALVSDPVAFARFVHEAQASASLFHENIATALDSGEIDGRFFIAMRFVPGVSLDRILKERGPLSWNEALKMVRQIGNALAYAHGHGFLHRDVKPANMLRATDGNYVLTDFGLAKAYLSSGLTTRTGVVLGTPSYIPPEIWDGQPATPASDIYSLACLLFEALTGQVLFHGDTPYSIMGSHAKERRFPEQWSADVPAGLTPILRKALEVQSSERYQTVSEFMAALESLTFVTSQPVPAQQPTETIQVEQIIQPEPKVEVAEILVETPQVEQLTQPEPISENIPTTMETSWEEQKAPGEPKPEVVEASAGVPVKEQPVADKQSRFSWRKAGIGFIILAGLVGLIILVREATQWGRLAGTNPVMISAAQTTTAVAQKAKQITTQNAVVALMATPTKMHKPTTFATPATTTSLTAMVTSTTIPEYLIPPACLEIGQQWISPADGMTLVCVPAGEFAMGSAEGDADEQPVHDVNLEAYWIDQTEVTNAQYARCVAAGNCEDPSSDQYNDSAYTNHPVVGVSWYDAVTYCHWAGRSLPSEAQWEKAARSDDKRMYPWGDFNPESSLANYGNVDRNYAEVGGYPDGASPYGALDMAGNVWEWVADWYNDDYYRQSPKLNPFGPITGEQRVLRGGSWRDLDYYLRSSFRSKYYPDVRNRSHFGFRCARGTSPVGNSQP